MDPTPPCGAAIREQPGLEQGLLRVSCTFSGTSCGLIRPSHFTLQRGSLPPPQPHHTGATVVTAASPPHTAQLHAAPPRGSMVDSRRPIGRGSSWHWAQALGTHNPGNFKPTQHEAPAPNPPTHQEQSFGCSGPPPDSRLQHLGCLIMLGLAGTSCQVPPSARSLLFIGEGESYRGPVTGKGVSKPLLGIPILSVTPSTGR